MLVPIVVVVYKQSVLSTPIVIQVFNSTNALCVVVVVVVVAFHF